MKHIVIIIFPAGKTLSIDLQGGPGGGQKSVYIRWVLYQRRVLYYSFRGLLLYNFADGILYLLVRGFRRQHLKIRIF